VRPFPRANFSAADSVALQFGVYLVDDLLAYCSGTVIEDAPVDVLISRIGEDVAAVEAKRCRGEACCVC